MAARVLLLVCTMAAVALACHDGVPNCDREDLGSCGTACCKMEYMFNTKDTEEVKNELMKVLGMGGPDNQYAMQTTAFGSFGFDDTRSYNISDPVTGEPIEFLGQAVHTTGPLGVECVFHDIVNFKLDAPSSSSTRLTAFSLSTIAGALGDSGQNYYNIVTVVSKLNPNSAKTIMGCPPPS